jgi:F-type H+-transporting ATPase subunit b
MAEPTAHTEVPAGQNKFPPFQSQHFPSQVLWLTVTFVLLYALMSRIALPRVGAILAERSKRIGDDLQAAQDFKERSESADAAYRKSLADARANAQAIANETRAKQAAEAEATNKRLEGELHEKLQAAERSIAATRTAAMANVGGIAVETAAAIVERLIGSAPTAQDVAAAVREAGKA